MNAAHGLCQPISPGELVKAELKLSSVPESSSLKFTTRLSTESTWHAYEHRETHNPTQPLAAASARDWKATNCALLIGTAGAVLTCGWMHFLLLNANAAEREPHEQS